MKKELVDLAEWSIKTALSAGADACRVDIDSSRFVDIAYRERRPENIKEAAQMGLGIQIFVQGRWSYQNTSDLRREALKTFIANAVVSTRLLAEDPFRSLPDPEYYRNRSQIDLGIYDADYAKVTPESRHDLVKSIEDACLREGGEKVLTATAQAYDSRNESVLMSSNGFSGTRRSTVYWAGARVTVRDDGDRRPNGYNYLASVTLRDLPQADDIGRVAARRTLDLLGGKKIKTETLPIIIENRNCPRILGGLVSAMVGSNIQQKRSFLADKKDQEIAGSALTLVDDPFIIGGLGSRLFDGDGITAQSRVMIGKGALKNFFVDWYYSRKLGCQPTTGSPSNLVIPPGKRPVQEIMKDLGRGILVTGFIGGNSNSTTGDVSIGIIGKLFEDGIPSQSVAEMNIADNHLTFWRKLAEVANDPWIYSSWRIPSLVFTDVVVSGL